MIWSRSSNLNMRRRKAWTESEAGLIGFGLLSKRLSAALVAPTAFNDNANSQH